MRCPYCRNTGTDVVETRIAEDGSNIRRRRTCMSCKKRFTTYERIENVTLIVKKKDGRREQFDREKLKSGIIKACEKTDVPVDKIHTIVDFVEQELRNSDTTEVESRKIGQLTASKLKKIDKVAYIRFASVFKRFVDVDDFEKEVQKLTK